MKIHASLSILAATLLTSACSKKEEPAPAAPSAPKAAPQQTSSTPAPPAQPAAQATLSETVEKKVKHTEVTLTQSMDSSKKELTATTSSLTSNLSVAPTQVLGDLDLSMEAVKEKVSGLGMEQLTAYASQYKDVILEYKDKIAGMSDKVKGLSMGDVFGEKGKALKNELANYTNMLTGLKDRYGIYLDKLKEYGVDLSAYGL